MEGRLDRVVWEIAVWLLYGQTTVLDAGYYQEDLHGLGHVKLPLLVYAFPAK